MAQEETNILKSAFSKERYQQLEKFMIKVWRSDYKYKVILARRAFNLQYAFWNENEEAQNGEYRSDAIMSNTAILFRAEELADSYRRNQAFPEILIVDDVLLHGRGIMKLVYTLENLIADFLREKGDIYAKQDIHDSLMNAILIYVFARNREQLLLGPEYRYRSEHIMQISELRGLSQEISGALQQCTVANTSYVLSTKLSSWDYKILQGRNHVAADEDSFLYQGNAMLLYLKEKNGIKETIRINKSLSNDGSSINSLISLAIFPDIEKEKFNTICNDIAVMLKKINSNSSMAKLLGYQQDLLMKPRGQLISFIFSIKSFAEFYKEYIADTRTLLYRAILNSDYKKIASNFQSGIRMEVEVMNFIKEICYNPDFCNEIGRILYSAGNETGNEHNERPEQSNSFSGYERVHIDFGEEDHSPFETAEDLFYEIGMNADVDANECCLKRKKFNPAVSGSDIIDFNFYLSYMKRKKVDYKVSIGCLLSMMDSGLLSMNTQYQQEKLSCILKTGELSIYILPRRFHEFLPALAMVERGYRTKSDDQKLALSSFINYLDENCESLGGRYADDYQKDISRLRKEKANLLYMYHAGQSFRDWDNGLKSENDRFVQRDSRGRLQRYSTQRSRYKENQDKNFYKYCAGKYLHSDAY